MSIGTDPGIDHGITFSEHRPGGTFVRHWKNDAPLGGLDHDINVVIVYWKTVICNGPSPPPQ